MMSQTQDLLRSPQMSGAGSLLEMRGITRRFPGVLALDQVDFEVRRGEIHALMGENGAGKSTLIKVLTGVHRRDAGTVSFEGASVDPRSPRAAEEMGISTVYQEVNLIPHMSIAENICLGREPGFMGVIDWFAVSGRARQALARLDLHIDVSQELSSCSIAIQQMVAIARALDVSARLLILDEPTSSLDPNEVAELFGVLRRLRDSGMAIIFVTHFLDQVYEVSDRITVLRDGRWVGTYQASKLPRLELVGRMLGKEFVQSVQQHAPPRQRQAAAPAALVEARQLGRAGSICPIDLCIEAGETVGLAGLLGSGRTETARLLFGIDRADSGQLLIGGRRAQVHNPRQAIGHGLGFTSENRKAEGIIPHLSVRENIILAMQGARGVWARIPRQEQERIARKFIAALGIRTPHAEQPAGNLSGGNQQKVLLARWLAMNPRLLILDEPTRGIDVGAKAEIEKLVNSLRQQGMAVLFISSELEEMVRTCQRVIVLRDRMKVGELAGEAISEQSIMQTIARPAHEA
jgi:galactofuranose transport system ATP-binding protein